MQDYPPLVPPRLVKSARESLQEVTDHMMAMSLQADLNAGREPPPQSYLDACAKFAGDPGDWPPPSGWWIKRDGKLVRYNHKHITLPHPDSTLITDMIDIPSPSSSYQTFSEVIASDEASTSSKRS